MKKIICLVRHGQTNQNKKKKIQGRKDFPLNNTGRNEALVTGKFLKEENIKWDVIYSSPLQRAKETASIIKNIIGYKNNIIIDEAFIERDFGNSEGLDVNYENFVKIVADDFKGLEKSIDLQNRVYNGVMNVIDTTNYQKILIVAHSHTIKGLLTKLDKSIKFDKRIENCALNYFTYDGENITIDEYNVSPLKGI